jgi:FkbM family methyltransferase
VSIKLQSRLSFFLQILKGKSNLFKEASFIGKAKLIGLSLAKIPFSTFTPQLNLRFGRLILKCAGSYEIHLYPEIFLDKVYSQMPGFSPVDLREGYVVIDVGANIGIYSVFVSVAKSNGKIYAFEPHPRALERLRINLKKNGIENVQIINKAVWSSDADIGFEMNKYTVLSRASEEEISGVRVSAISLDSFVEQYGIERIDILKVDAEYAEDAIVAGAESRALAMTDRIVLECHSEDLRKKVEKILKNHKFQKVLQNGKMIYFEGT